MNCSRHFATPIGFPSFELYYCYSLFSRVLISHFKCFQLLNTCKNADPSSEMDIIVNKMWKRFHQADISYTSSAKFLDFVKTLIKKAPKEPFCQLKSISDDLKFHKVQKFYKLMINFCEYVCSSFFFF